MLFVLFSLHGYYLSQANRAGRSYKLPLSTFYVQELINLDPLHCLLLWENLSNVEVKLQCVQHFCLFSDSDSFHCVWLAVFAQGSRTCCFLPVPLPLPSGNEGGSPENLRIHSAGKTVYRVFYLGVFAWNTFNYRSFNAVFMLVRPIITRLFNSFSKHWI